MAFLASQLASELLPGDCYCLYGDVGAGKSAFSRAFVRAAAGDPGLPVPSPTYLLQNTYETHGQPPVHHFDLYRLSGERELQRLELRRAMAGAVCLFEWAERLQSQTPSDRLALHISIMEEGNEAGAASSSLLPGSRNKAQANVVSSREEGTAAVQGGQEAGMFEELEGGEEEGEEEWDLYSDQRCRRVELEGHGDLWRGRLLRLGEAITASTAARESGLVLFGWGSVGKEDEYR